MSEQRIQDQPSSSPPPPSLLLPPSSDPRPMPALTSQPSDPPSNSKSSPPPPNPAPSSLAPAPESGTSCALSSSRPSPLPVASPDRNPSAVADPDLRAKEAESTAASPVGPSTSTAPPTKIPFRPRKTRKLAASSSSPAVQVRDDKASAASPEGGNAGAMVVAGGGAPTVLNNHICVVYHVPPRPLSSAGEVSAAVHHLRAADLQLAKLIDAHEPPCFQSLHPPFHSLTRSILYQQLAFKAAASIYSRFLALCGGEDGVVPEVVLGLTPQQLRQIGVSARKASYLHDLANKYRNGILSDSSIVAMDDKSLFTMLNMVKGIGAWSVHMFMIFSLHRPDVLPVGDVGVRKGVQLLYGLDSLPRPSQMEQLCERWKPYRSVGSWYVWRLVEAKGMPVALATASSGGAVVAVGEGGGCGMTSHVLGGPPSLPPPLPRSLQPLHLRQQIQQQHLPLQQHLQQHEHLHMSQHPHPNQHQHQHQHQLQPQLIDAIQSIPNLG